MTGMKVSFAPFSSKCRGVHRDRLAKSGCKEEPHQLLTLKVRFQMPSTVPTTVCGREYVSRQLKIVVLSS